MTNRARRVGTRTLDLDQALAVVDGFGPCLLVLCGAAGAGKSTLARRCWPDDVVVSLDVLRGWLTGNPGDQSRNPEVAAMAHAQIGVRCAAGLRTVFDSTCTTPARRRVALDLTSGLPAIAVRVDQPLEVCVDRQRARRPGRQVPVHAIRRMCGELASATPEGLVAEGFAAALVFRAVGGIYEIEACLAD